MTQEQFDNAMRQVERVAALAQHVPHLRALMKEPQATYEQRTLAGKVWELADTADAQGLRGPREVAHVHD